MAKHAQISVRRNDKFQTVEMMLYFQNSAFHARCTGVFKQVNFMGIGMQIDVYAEKMTDTQLGIFCITGAIAAFIAGYTILVQ